MNLTKNPSLLIGVSIPVLMVIFVGASIYLPGLFLNPESDFLYMVGGDYRYNCTEDYVVSGKKLTRIVRTGEPQNGHPAYRECVVPTFYVYETDNRINREVTFEEAEAFLLDSSKMSPDGFEVVRGGRGGDFLFLFGSSRNYNSVYLRGGNMSRKIELKGANGSSSYNYYDFQFLGWILPS